MGEGLGGVSVHLLGAVPLDIIILDLAAVIDEALGQRWTIWAQRPRWWNRGHRTERSAGKKRAWPRPSSGCRGGHGKQQRRLLLSGILHRTQCAHRRRGDLCGCCGICVTVEGERGARDRGLKKETKGRGLSAGVRARACRHLWRAKGTGGIDRAAHQEKRRAGAGGVLGEERGRVCFD